MVFNMKKRQIVIVSMVAIISVAVFLNWQLNKNGGSFGITDTINENQDKNLGEAELVNNNGGDAVSEVFNKSNYFEEARLNRQKSRDEMIDSLKTMSTDSNNSNEVRNKASSDMLAVTLNIEKETKIENMVKSKGFADCVVTLSTTNAHVVVKTSGLQPNEAAQIKEIVTNETSFKGNNIKIVEIK